MTATEPERPAEEAPLGEDVQARVIGICHQCAHRTSLFNCKAFPNGIPGVILKGEFLHVEPFPGDNGIQFLKGA